MEVWDVSTDELPIVSAIVDLKTPSYLGAKQSSGCSASGVGNESPGVLKSTVTAR